MYDKNVEAPRPMRKQLIAIATLNGERGGRVEKVCQVLKEFNLSFDSYSA